MNKLAPSILAADFTKLGEQVQTVAKSGVQMLHIDVMDGMFVPSISFGMPVIESLRPSTDMFFDVHLMVEQPERYIDTFAAIGADGITIHAEACKHLHRAVHQIKDLGKKCCVALNPATPLQELEYLLPDLDMVLIMTVNPGFGGQKFIGSSMQKIQTLREKCNQLGLQTDIQVDGGVNLKNAKEILDAGANVLVAGSCVFNGDIAANVAAFQEICKA